MVILSLFLSLFHFIDLDIFYLLVPFVDTDAIQADPISNSNRLTTSMTSTNSSSLHTLAR